MEKETTARVGAILRQIDDELYGDGDDEDDDDNRRRRRLSNITSPSSSPSLSMSSSSRHQFHRKPLSEGIKEECGIWREKFPHLRYVLLVCVQIIQF